MSTFIGLKHSFLALLLVSGFAGQAFGQSSVTAKKDGVNVTKEASKDSAVIKTLKKGEQIEAVERTGMFWKVNAGGGQGYVSVMAVERQAAEANSLSKTIQGAVTEGREADDGASGQRARSAVMGVRGLDETKEAMAAGSVRPNLRMVYRMEDRHVMPAKVKELEQSIMAEVEAKASKAGN